MLVIGLDAHQRRAAVAAPNPDTGKVRERNAHAPDESELPQESRGRKRLVLEAGDVTSPPSE